MKWITNCAKTEVEKAMADLTSGKKERKIIIGDPKASAWFTVEELKSSPDEYVGLYGE